MTSIDPLTGGVFIDWDEPHDGNKSIHSYIIEIGDSELPQGWHEEGGCPGIDESVTSCLVSMDVLTAAPFNLAFDDLVEVRITAFNSYGSSDTSEVNTDGARIRRVPD